MTGPDDRHAFLSLLGWPPPGLARIQGDLWLVVCRMWAAAVVLVLPLLFVVAIPQSPMGLGPLEGAWWITLVTTLFGLLLFADATAAFLRVLGRSRRAVREGYSLSVVGLVLSDRSRDGGFLFQGAQVYSTMSRDERRALALLRVAGPLASLAAAAWLVVAFSVLVLFAARGVGSPLSVAMSTLLPTALFALIGFALRAVEGTLLKGARRAWFNQPWSQDLARRDVTEWRDAVQARGLASATASSPTPSRLFALSFGVVLITALLAIVAPVTLVPVSSVGAVFGSVAGMRYAGVLERVARAEPYRRFRLPPDSSVTPGEAGEILNALTRVGSTRPLTEGLRAPVREFEDPWIPESPIDGWRTDIPPFWTDTLWAHMESGLSSTELEYLRRTAAHPARSEFARLARASSVDVMGGRHDTPFDEEMTMWNLPIPRYSSLRFAAYAYVGIAALRSTQDRHAEAEESAREVVSVGFLLMEESPTLIGNLIGAVLVRIGGEGLMHVLRRSGQMGRADQLAEAVAVTARAVSRMAPAVRGRTYAHADPESLPEMAVNPDLMRGLRWEQLHLVSSVTPCLNLQRVVFGPGDEYTEWLERMRVSLVRFPSEEALFDLASRGFAVDTEPGFVVRLLSIAMRGMETRGSCAQLVSGLPYFM